MNEKSISIWENPAQIEEVRKIYGQQLTPQEFGVFLGIGQATGLNPFLRELYAVKYGGSPAQIFIGRDGYRRSAQSHSDYDWHQVDAVYSNDVFEVKEGGVIHNYNLNDRGFLQGAYCITKRRNSSRPIFTYVELKEYTTGKSIWATKPATMIKKVAEAQGLRMTFQALFAGTYDESEQWEDKKKPEVAVRTPRKRLEKVVKTVVSEERQKNIRELFALWNEFVGIMGIKKEEEDMRRREGLMKMYGVDSTTKLTGEQLRDYVTKLRQVVNDYNIKKTELSKDDSKVVNKVDNNTIQPKQDLFEEDTQDNATYSEHLNDIKKE